MVLDLATALAVRSQQVRPTLTHVIGWVTASTSTTVTVQLAGGDLVEDVPKLRAFTPNTDDVVLMLNAGGALYCLGALNAAPTPPPEPEEDEDEDPAPAPELVEKTRTWRPSFTGTYRGSWRGDTSDLYQGDWTGRGRNYGAAYYGQNGPSAVSGDAVSGTVRIKRLSGGVYAAVRPTLRLLDHKTRPGGFPSFSKSMQGPLMSIGDTRRVGLPTGWVQDLIDGNAGGIGIGVGTNSPYVHLAGKGVWGPAMELTITWEKS